MNGYGRRRQLPLPETRFISRGVAEGNIHGQGALQTACVRNNHTLTVLLCRYNAFMPVHLHLLSFYDHVNLNVTLLCQDYVMVRRLSLKIF